MRDFHHGLLGGVNVITDSNGTRCQLNEYDPWGGVSRSEVSQPACDPTHRFTGQELDPETGLYYYGGRYYDQEISRFVSPDAYVQEPDEPQNLNRYSYVLNNPQAYVDPSGQFFWTPFIVALLEVLAYITPTTALEGAIVGGLSAATAQAIATTFAVAWAASLDHALKSNAELGNDKTTPGQTGTNIQLNTSNNPLNKEAGDDYPGNDHPGDEGPLWQRPCIHCAVNIPGNDSRNKVPKAKSREKSLDASDCTATRNCLGEFFSCMGDCFIAPGISSIGTEGGQAAGSYYKARAWQHAASRGLTTPLRSSIFRRLLNLGNKLGPVGTLAAFVGCEGYCLYKEAECEKLF